MTTNVEAFWDLNPRKNNSKDYKKSEKTYEIGAVEESVGLLVIL